MPRLSAREIDLANAAAVLGQKGGRAVTSAKIAAARRNVKKARAARRRKRLTEQ